MKYLIITIFIISSTLINAQKKLYLNKEISISIDKRFTKIPPLDEVLNQTNNTELKEFIKKDEEFVFKQKAFNITSEKNPKSFINVSINKSSISETMNNSSLSASKEGSDYISNYLDNEVTNNFLKSNSTNAKFVQKNKIIKINGINIFNCIIHTNLEARKNDFLSTTSYIYYIFYENEILYLSIDVTDNDKITWEKIKDETINSLSLQNLK